MNLENEIKEIKAALARIELAISGQDKTQASRKKSIRKDVSENDDDDNFSGATGGVRLLISKGFFKQRRQFGEIKSTLQADGYLYSKQAFQNAVARMAKVGGPLTAIKQGKNKVYAERK